MQWRQALTFPLYTSYPGGVKTNFGKNLGTWTIPVRAVFNLIGPIFLKHISSTECGMRQVSGATSARFQPAKGDAAGVPLAEGIPVARGSDGKPGSGSYTINFDSENVSPRVYERLAKAKSGSAEERLWAHILGEIKDITGRSC